MAVKSFIVLAAVAYGVVANPLRFAVRSAPSNIAPGSFTNCTTYETVETGGTCSSLEATNGISFSDLLRWNPELNTACTLLEANYAYCVGGGGDACPKLYTVVSGDLCAAIETNEDITAAQLQALNPWLDANCDLEIGQVLCVGTGSATTTSTVSSSTAPATTTTSTTASATPTNIAPGTWSNCTQYYTVTNGGTCDEIVSINDIAYSDFLRWNPEVDVACDNLQLDAYCVKDTPACNIYTVVSGDYCAGIEDSYGLTSTQLYDLNPWLDSACDLQPGENLCVGLRS
ncbi:hypothetical protein FOMPIDRAFT_1047927 [Fomitopsis schrenkii]|uniref:LysM domain-containing protein n=1 Tax=Fomitopsis schrenkii TaxID=2126942 RepID=S8EBD0_FOMSC|nr:hypothetical protein FOMPIDRAFT_1047927 [Fomitopsis schrenkii]